MSALFESISHAGEQFPVSVAVIVLIVFLSPCAISGVKHLVLFSAGNGGCAYSVVVILVDIVLHFNILQSVYAVIKKQVSKNTLYLTHYIYDL